MFRYQQLQKLDAFTKTIIPEQSKKFFKSKNDGKKWKTTKYNG